jgi:hypothetical protein
VCTTALAAALFAFSIPQAIDPQEVLQYSSLLGYAFLAALYTVFVFSSELPKFDGPRIFSKENARTVPQMIAIHVAYLTMFLCLLRLASYIVLTVPLWMTNTFNAGRHLRLSIFDLLFLAVWVTLALIERRHLYVESESDSAEPNDSATAPNAD